MTLQCAALITMAVHAQTKLEITTGKTTSLIFPFPIQYVDRGTADVITQPVKDNATILLVKAAVAAFKETNLSVVTSDGTVYNFTVNYSSQPDHFVYELPVNSKANVYTYANSILDNKRSMRVMRVEKNGIVASVIGIYIKDKVIYYQLQLCNHSPIDYDIDVLRFYIRDKKQPKRTAAQENDCLPLYVAGNNKQVKAYNFTVVVVALEKFTIPDAKFLGVQLMEKNGGRHIQLKIQNNKILRAVMLPDLH